MNTVSHHDDAVICHTCGFLTRFLILCDHCHDSIPRRTTFTPNRGLVRYEADPPVSSVRASISAAKSLRQKYRHVLSELEQSCFQLESFIEYQESRLSPIKRVSSDVLVEIFSFAVQDQGISTGFGPTTLLLTEVCSTWRRLVTSVPLLWSCFSIFCAHPDWIRAQRWKVPPLETLDLYIRRSDQAPLSIQFILEEDSGWLTPEPPRHDMSRLFLRRMKQVASRIAHLDIPSTHIQRLHGPFNSLTSLRIRSHSWRDPDLPATLEAPQLRRVFLDLENVYVFLKNFEQITELHVGKREREGDYMPMHIGIISLKLLALHSFSSLRCLSLYNLNHTVVENAQFNPPIMLPVLEILCILIQGQHLTPLPFFTPKLAELIIHSKYRDPYTPGYTSLPDPNVSRDPHAIEWSLANFSCTRTLQRLDLRDINIPPLSLLRIICSHSEVRDLSLKELHYFPHQSEVYLEPSPPQPNYELQTPCQTINTEFLQDLILSQSFPFSRLSLETKQSSWNEDTLVDTVMLSLGHTHLEKLEITLHNYIFGGKVVRTIQEACKVRLGPEISISTSLGASFLKRGRVKSRIRSPAGQWGHATHGA